MSEFPGGWALAKLGEIAETIRGVTYKKAEARSEPGDGCVPLLRATNIVGGVLALDHELVYVPSSRVSDTQLLSVGDIVIAASSGSRAVVGKSAPLRHEWSGTFGAFCSVARPRSPIDALYVAHFLGSETVRRRWSSLATGTNINNLKREHLTETPVPVAPLNEQRRIVAAIEEHLSRLDAADASLTAATRRLERMPAVVLSSAINGSEIVRLADVAEVRLGRQRSPRNHTGPNMVPYLRAANVTWRGLDLSDVKTMNFSPAELPTYALRNGDVLLSEASGSADEVGKPAMWRGQIAGCCFQNTLIRVRSRGPEPEYLHKVFLRDALTGKFAQAAPGVGIHHLGSTRLSEWDIPLPPLEEQRRIVAEVEERLSAIDALRAAIERAQRRSAALRRAILERAFRGELVPQNPSDEPAEALLARIRAEAAASSTRLIPRGDKKHQTR